MAQEITAIAIDKDKHSQSALKWAVDNLLSSDPIVFLIHVRVRNQHAPEANREKFENDVKQLFIPYRGYCARKRVSVKEVILDDMDISEAIVAYINHNYINNIVVGASTRGFLQSFTKKHDVPSVLTKTAPDFCSVYVVAKGKPVTIKTASRPPPINAPQLTPSSPPLTQHSMDSPCISVSEDNIRRSWRREEGSDVRSSTERIFIQRDKSLTTPRPTDNGFTPRSADVMYTPRSSDIMYTPRSNDVMYTHRSSYGHGSNIDGDSCYSGSFGYRIPSASSNEFSSSSAGDSSTSVIEAEMRSLKMELKHTMDLYSTACKEAILAKQNALEFQQWRTNEARRFEDVRLAEEAALASAQKEKAKAQAAREAAEASRRLAQMEEKRRKEFEMRAQTELDERSQVVNALESNNIRYRKYELGDIRAATDNFSNSLKIGEGGYGPVYKAYLDHTPVAVKVLKSDAAQGMKQFQQEVEVLSCIRHPNMVLLLGACPESGCLVYEYMDNGSLDDRLFHREGTPPIPWWIRFKIAAEIATGLLFLHQTKPEPLVHRDLKPGNILLDRNYVSKISDVGLARLVPPSVADNVTQYHMTSAAGTFCYIDPEYQQTGMLGTKSDVYSLGIMLLQIITARPPMGLAHNVEGSIERGTFQDLLDPTVTDWPVEEALSYAKMALRCAELRRKDRPDLRTEILPELNRLKALGYSESICFSSFNSPTNSSTFSSPTNSYNSHSHQKPPRSNEETIKDPMSRNRTPPHRSPNGYTL